MHFYCEKTTRGQTHGPVGGLICYRVAPSSDQYTVVRLGGPPPLFSRHHNRQAGSQTVRAHLILMHMHISGAWPMIGPHCSSGWSLVVHSLWPRAAQ